MLDRRHKKIIGWFGLVILTLYLLFIGAYYVASLFDPKAIDVTNGLQAFQLGQKYHHQDSFLKNTEKAQAYYDRAIQLGYNDAIAFKVLLKVKQEENIGDAAIIDLAQKALDTHTKHVANLALWYIYSNPNSSFYDLYKAEKHILAAANAGLPMAEGKLYVFYLDILFSKLPNAPYPKNVNYWGERMTYFKNKYSNSTFLPRHIVQWYFENPSPPILNPWYRESAG